LAVQENPPDQFPLLANAGPASSPLRTAKTSDMGKTSWLNHLDHHDSLENDGRFSKSTAVGTQASRNQSLHGSRSKQNPLVFEDPERKPIGSSL
jgi:hypothetical protein